MLSLISSPFRIPNSQSPFSTLNSTNGVFRCLAFIPKKRARTFKRASVLTRFRGFEVVRKFPEPGAGLAQLSRCWSRLSDGDDAQLEMELLDFMEKSEKPSMFPTEEELRAGGREDLAEAIRKRGGWLSLGWDDGVVSSEETTNSVGIGFSLSAAGEPMDISLENGGCNDSGIQGILNNLEKQRNRDLGINSEKNGYVPRNDLAKIGEHRRHDQNGTLCASGTEPESWSSWVSKRARLRDFEAGEISFLGDKPENEGKNGHVITTLTSEGKGKAVDNLKEMDIHARLRHLELELNSVLHTLRSQRVLDIPEQVAGDATILDKLSDSWEFKENELMNSQEILRTLRAKIAVLEGKFALATIDSRRQVDDTRKQAYAAQRALKLLRTTSVVWATHASEVLLTGSFDGWTTKRKMRRSEMGEFSLFLKLYPGRYEIKFIVDGVWRIDPRRPCVYSNGFENNLLIVP